ncbi:MAG: NUDIX hydrolase [Eubacteriaceae bacterium]|nr:NUDIX hydrolase [Eubacteriaceae bacterium]
MEYDTKQFEALAWKKIGTEHIVQNRWIDFRVEEYRFPDGSSRGGFYTFSKRNFVVIVARAEDGRYICVWQYRQGIDQVTCEFPAGGMEEGENPLECARRELMEETGFCSDNWTELITIPANATICDNIVTVFFADSCVKTGEQNLDDTEYLNVELVDEEELEKRIFSGGFQQGDHVMGYLLSKRL